MLSASLNKTFPSFLNHTDTADTGVHDDDHHGDDDDNDDDNNDNDDDDNNGTVLKLD